MACHLDGLKPLSDTRILLLECLGTNLSEISIEIFTFLFKKIHLKIAAAK